MRRRSRVLCSVEIMAGDVSPQFGTRAAARFDGGAHVVECKDAADAEAVGMRIPVASNAWVQVRQLLLYNKE